MQVHRGHEYTECLLFDSKNILNNFQFKLIQCVFQLLITDKKPDHIHKPILVPWASCIAAVTGGICPMH